MMPQAWQTENNASRSVNEDSASRHALQNAQADASGLVLLDEHVTDNEPSLP